MEVIARYLPILQTAALSLGVRFFLNIDSWSKNIMSTTLQNPILRDNRLTGDVPVHTGASNASHLVDPEAFRETRIISEDPMVDKALNVPNLKAADGEALVRDAELLGALNEISRCAGIFS